MQVILPGLSPYMGRGKKGEFREWTTQYLTHAHSHITRAEAAISISMAKPSGRNRTTLCSLPFTAKEGAKQPFKHQLHTTLVGAGGWEPHGSSPTACVGKVDQQTT